MTLNQYIDMLGALMCKRSINLAFGQYGWNKLSIEVHILFVVYIPDNFEKCIQKLATV